MSRNQHRFVIQKHDATQLHYDFRLETGKALASWAVPKGFNLDPKDKHLAIRTDDHDKDYFDFEGVIEEPEYGAGTVMVWDIGTYELIGEKGKGGIEGALESGSFKFRLDGKKLAGGFALVQTGKRDGKERWMVFKLDDDDADARRNPRSTQPDSAKTGRSLEEIRKEAKNE